MGTKGEAGANVVRKEEGAPFDTPRHGQFNAVTIDDSPGAAPIPPHYTVMRVK